MHSSVLRTDFVSSATLVMALRPRVTLMQGLTLLQHWNVLLSSYGKYDLGPRNYLAFC